MAERTIIQRTGVIPVVILCLLFTAASPVFASPHTGEHTESKQDSRSKILSVLEMRTDDERILAKAAEKLQVLDGRELRLMASLSDRITADKDSAGATIAYSLMTALIVLS